MTCLGCGASTMNRGRICDACLPVFSNDGDSWDHKDAASCALREKIAAAQAEWHDDHADKGECAHCEAYALEAALIALRRRPQPIQPIAPTYLTNRDLGDENTPTLRTVLEDALEAMGRAIRGAT